jgi:hypothetical protein
MLTYFVFYDTFVEPSPATFSSLIMLTYFVFYDTFVEPSPIAFSSLALVLSSFRRTLRDLGK